MAPLLKPASILPTLNATVPVGVPREEPGLPPRWWRWLGVALTLALSETALVAAASPSGARLVEVARVDTASVAMMRVAGPMLFAVTLGGGTHLVGYRLADGAQRWSVPLDFSGTDMQIGGQIEVVDDAVPVSIAGLAAVRTVAVDAASGRELWRSDLPLVFGSNIGRSVVLGAYLNSDGIPGSPAFPGATGPQLPLLLRAVGARTGQLVWSYRVPAGSQTALPSATAGAEPAQGFVVISPNGQATTVDLASGTERTSATIDATAITRPARGDLPTGLAFGVYGDQLVLVTTRRGGAILAAYQVSTLGLQWMLAISAVDVNVSQCGPWLCVSDNHGTYAVTRDRGAPAWTMTNVGGFRGWAAGWIYDEPDAIQPDGATLIDPLTQRVVLDMGRWRILAPSNTGPVLMMLAERQSTRTWFGLLATGPRIDVLGAVTELTPNSWCEVGDRYLSCLTTSSQLRIWRYRR
jgi:outer membrane protein assembly factor BamB